MTAQFALFDHIEAIPGTPLRQLLTDRIDFVRRADELGYAGYHLAEHHGSELCMTPNQELFLAAIAQATTNIRIGPLVKVLPLHHPLRVIEDICVLDQLSGGRVDFGVGRGPVAIEHYWFQGGWDDCQERFDEALAVIAQGLHTGVAGGVASRKFYDFPPCDVTVSALQSPNPPFWYPGNPVTAGRYGMNLMWPGPIPAQAHEAYLQAWDKHRGDEVRFDAPGAKPRVGSAMPVVVHEDEATARDIAGRGQMGLSRRVMHVHTFDRLVLDEEAAEKALNPLALGARSLLAAGGGPELDARTAASGTPAKVTDILGSYLESGLCDYIMLSIPTGDQTFAEATDALELFASTVMRDLGVQPIAA